LEYDLITLTSELHSTNYGGSYKKHGQNKLFELSEADNDSVLKDVLTKVQQDMEN
jgi:hypothetical protein